MGKTKNKQGVTMKNLIMIVAPTRHHMDWEFQERYDYNVFKSIKDVWKFFKNNDIDVFSDFTDKKLGKNQFYKEWRNTKDNLFLRWEDDNSGDRNYIQIKLVKNLIWEVK